MMRGSFCAIFFILTSIAQPESCQGQGLAPGIGFSAKEIEVVRDAIARPLPDKPLEGVNEVCFNHLVAFQERVNRLFLLGGLNSSDTWALRMYDSTGHIPEGYLEGNTDVIGSFFECLDLRAENVYLVEGQQQLQPFMGRYMQAMVYKVDLLDLLPSTLMDDNHTFIVEPLNGLISIPPIPGLHLRGKLDVPALRLGLCSPSSCSKREVNKAINHRLGEVGFLGKRFVATVLFSGESDADTVKLDYLDILFISLVSMFLLLALGGTVLDMWDSRSQDNTAKKFLIGFSLPLHWKRLFSTHIPKSSDHINCINGLRFMSMSWVLLGHTYNDFQFRIPVRNFNVPNLLSQFDSFLVQVLHSSYVCVDSFFFISGLLVAYLTFKELDRSKGRLNLLMFYIHRYLRLTLIYAMVLLFRVSLYKYVPDGPNTFTDFEVQSCKDVIWRQFLYINNFQNAEFDDAYKVCAGPSWYLATDMQMFLVAPLIIWPMWKIKKFRFDYIWPGLWCLASTICLIVMTSVNDWPATAQLEGVDGNDTTYWLDNYYMPWTRFQPYGVGIILGYVLHQTRGQRVRLPRYAIVLGWTGAVGLGIAVVYGLGYPKIIHNLELPSEAVNVMYGSFHRLAWGVALAWMVWACVKGYGGFVNTFLSWEAFAPLSRLSYAMYLTHDMIVVFAAGWFTFSVDFSHFLAAILILWSLTVTLLISIPVVVLLEMPLLHLEKFVFLELLGVGKKPTKH